MKSPRVTKKYDLKHQRTLNTLTDIDLEQMEMDMSGEQNRKNILHMLQSLKYIYFTLAINFVYGLAQICIVLAEDKLDSRSNTAMIIIDFTQLSVLVVYLIDFLLNLYAFKKNYLIGLIVVDIIWGVLILIGTVIETK